MNNVNEDNIESINTSNKSKNKIIIFNLKGKYFILSYYNLRNFISIILNIPIEAIQSLENFFGSEYGLSNFNKSENLYIKINPLFNRLSNDIRIVSSDYSRLNTQYNNLNNEKNRLDGELSSIRNNYSNLQNDYNELSRKNKDNERRITTLNQNNEQNQREINNLNQQIKIEKEEKRKKEENFQKFKESFEKSQKIIEEKNVKETKIFILKFISNKFLKEFETKKEKES
jgi:hypothetical protein